MVNLSVVILTKNEQANIVDCITSARLLTEDIIIVDSGSNDATVELATQQGATIITSAWEGYGTCKNKGANKAKYDWILSIDADERLSTELVCSIRELHFESNCIYECKRENYLNNKKTRFGTSGYDKVARLYNRRNVSWDLSPVHEKLSGTFTKKKIKGALIHCNKTREDYAIQLIHYANLSAKKYFEQQKKATLVKRFLSPLFNSAKSYIFQLGFLDGKTGYTSAVLIAYYTWLKYHYLYQLCLQQKKEDLFSYLETLSKPITFSAEK